jgi:hypothetical protein
MLSNAVPEGRDAWITPPEWSDSNTPPETIMDTATAAATGTRSDTSFLRREGTATALLSGSSGAPRMAVANLWASALNALQEPQRFRCPRSRIDSNSDSSPSIAAEIDPRICSHFWERPRTITQCDENSGGRLGTFQEVLSQSSLQGLSP